MNDKVATSIHLTKLPKNIEILAIASINFNNFCFKAKSGREVRGALHNSAQRNYDFKNCRLSREEFVIFRDFFQARHGCRYGFLFRDQADFNVEKQPINASYYNNDIIKLMKIYKDEVSPHYRLITRPVPSSIKLYNNDQIIDKENFKIVGDQINLASKLFNQQQLTISFEFDVPVRFSQGQLDYEFNDDGTISLINTSLIEIYD